MSSTTKPIRAEPDISQPGVAEPGGTRLNWGTQGIAGFWAAIPAGGAGTRLWPLSRTGHPKFLHDLTGTGRTLIQAAADRVGPLAGERVIVVTGAAHAEAVQAQLPNIAPHRILAEPSPRDSMAAIAWAAAMVERVEPGAVLGSFAADHVIPDSDAFRACIAEAVDVAREGLMVTIGVEPTYPATGFGYIRMGHRLPGHRTAALVEEFVEKPDEAQARRYLATGEFRWNAGMFLVQCGVLLDLLGRWHPDLASGARAIAADPSLLADLWPTLERITIDHAVAEPAAAEGRVAVVRGDFAWKDVGDFATLAEALPADGPVTVLGDPASVFALDATGFVVAGGERTVALVGVADLVVVDTPDALLVTTRARAQDVKTVVDTLKETGRTDLV